MLVLTGCDTGPKREAARLGPRCDPAARTNLQSVDTLCELAVQPLLGLLDLVWAPVSAGNAVNASRSAAAPASSSAAAGRRSASWSRPRRAGPRPRRHPAGRTRSGPAWTQRRVDRDRVDALDVHRALSHLRPARLGRRPALPLCT